MSDANTTERSNPHKTDVVFNTKRVLSTLELVLPIIKSNTQKYWFMGSLVPTALNKSLYREIHDFDIIIFTKNLDKLLSDLYSLGYKKKPMNFLRVSELLGVYVFSHSTLLDIGFFVIDEEERCYSITAGPVRVEIPLENLHEKEYRLSNQSFLGIDPSFAYILSLLHKENPKRIKEFALYKSLGVIPAKWPIYSIYFFGMKANWMIDGLNSLLILIGKIRTKFGLPYDPWL